MPPSPTYSSDSARDAQLSPSEPVSSARSTSGPRARSVAGRPAFAPSGTGIDPPHPLLPPVLDQCVPVDAPGVGALLAGLPDELAEPADAAARAHGRAATDAARADIFDRAGALGPALT